MMHDRVLFKRSVKPSAGCVHSSTSSCCNPASRQILLLSILFHLSPLFLSLSLSSFLAILVTLRLLHEHRASFFFRRSFYLMLGKCYHLFFNKSFLLALSSFEAQIVKRTMMFDVIRATDFNQIFENRLMD